MTHTHICLCRPTGSCGQITITNGGNGVPGPKVAIPGAYSATDPGIHIGIYWPPVSCLFRGGFKELN